MMVNEQDKKNPLFTETHCGYNHSINISANNHTLQVLNNTREKLSWSWIADQNLNEGCGSNMAHVITEGVKYAFMGTELGPWILNEPEDDFN